jgi:serine/threonine protein kinase
VRKTDFEGYRIAEEIRGGSGTYRIEARISRGKFGETFRCRDEWGRPRILRVLLPFSRSAAGTRERWGAQADELRSLQHPNLVHVHDHFFRGEVFHLVVERCDYRLDRYLSSSLWDGVRWFKTVAREVLLALDHLHRHGRFHRNLQPHNVFLVTALETLHPDALFEGALKLGDWAVNHLLGDVEVVNSKLPRWLVPPEYLSPSDFGPMDQRADVYQAGLLLLCVLQGRVLRYSFEEISTGVPAQQAEKLESSYGPVVARALSPKVADRHVGARALWAALEGSSEQRVHPVAAAGA